MPPVKVVVAGQRYAMRRGPTPSHPNQQRGMRASHGYLAHRRRDSRADSRLYELFNRQLERIELRALNWCELLRDSILSS